MENGANNSPHSSRNNSSHQNNRQRRGRGRGLGRGGNMTSNDRQRPQPLFSFNPNAPEFQFQIGAPPQPAPQGDSDSGQSSPRRYPRNTNNNHHHQHQQQHHFQDARLHNSQVRPSSSSGQRNKYVDRRRGGREETTTIPKVVNSTQPDFRNQRERLIDQLNRHAYDCMVCVERIQRSNHIWSCHKCFNIFHLKCVSTWANSSKDEYGWRCPGCQSVYQVIPYEYRCFCSKLKNPSTNAFCSDIPHSCGGTCGKTGGGGADGEGQTEASCPHPCPILCHPGPCPPCESISPKKCCCGKITVQAKCSSKSILTCGNVCDKILNCNAHKCSKPCHGGECDDCAVILKLECHCKSEKKEEICSLSAPKDLSFSCGKICGRVLQCKNHSCEDKCHPGACKPCKLSPASVISCPCGLSSIREASAASKLPIRTSCLDPIPVCGKICGRILACGGGLTEHKCQSKCHHGTCPSCPLTTAVKCRCGNKTFEVKCIDFDPTKEYTCEKKCSKKRSCGRHKCNGRCCTDLDHICPIICDRALRCGNHRCSLLCHNGHCPPCRVASFEELSCECGASVIYPPVACGTRPPPCTQPCPRTHECGHPVLHHCHSEAECPPCTVLTEKWCHGHHELRKSVACHINQISCGMPCQKRISCGRHICIRSCHSGPCLAEGEKCSLPCKILNPQCGHVCGTICHEPPCPKTKCKVVSEVSCQCGRRQETMICWKRETEYDRLVYYLSNLELKKNSEIKYGEGEEEEEGARDFETILASMKLRTPKPNVLECDKECARVERNRKLVEALQLEDNPETSTFGTPNYCEFLMTFTKKYPQFVENVHDRLTNLVVKAKRSKRKNETYSFESMNRDKRRVVHEYSDHFCILSESFDDEPNRNVIITASKDKSYLPSVSLIDAVFRPTITSERKNTFNDVEIFANSKSQIMRPANGKITNSAQIPSSSGMVALTNTNSSGNK